MAARKDPPKKPGKRASRTARELELEAQVLEGKWGGKMQKGGRAPVEAFERTGVSELWTEANRNAVLKAVEGGARPQVAFPACGVPQRIWAIWLKHARAGVPEYVVFFEAIGAARARALVRWGGMLELAARGAKLRIEQQVGGKVKTVETEPDVKALSFLLERTAPEHWGKTVKNEHTGKGGGPIEVQKYVPPFRIDPEFRDWTKAEMRTYAEKGIVPERFRDAPAKVENVLSPTADLEGYLSSL